MNQIQDHPTQAQDLSPQYLALVERVRRIDGLAAEYMLDEARFVSGFDPDADSLGQAFIWCETRQRGEYWYEIYAKLQQQKQAELYYPALEPTTPSAAADRLPSDPTEAAKEVVRKAKDQYAEKDYKEFRYQVVKEFEAKG